MDYYCAAFLVAVSVPLAVGDFSSPIDLSLFRKGALSVSTESNLKTSDETEQLSFLTALRLRVGEAGALWSRMASVVGKSASGTNATAETIRRVESAVVCALVHHSGLMESAREAAHSLAVSKAVDPLVLSNLSPAWISATAFVLWLLREAQFFKQFAMLFNNFSGGSISSLSRYYASMMFSDFRCCLIPESSQEEVEQLPFETLSRFCAQQRLETFREESESSRLSMSKALLKMAKLNKASWTSLPTLEVLAQRVEEMGAFLSLYQPQEVALLAAPSEPTRNASSVHSEHVSGSLLSIFQATARLLFSPESLLNILSRRERVAQTRAQAYDLVAALIGSLHMGCGNTHLIRNVLTFVPIRRYDDDLEGCSSGADALARSSFSALLQCVARLLRSSPLPPLDVLRIAVKFCGLPLKRQDASMLLETQLLVSLLHLVGELYRVDELPVLGEKTNRCSFAITGRNYSRMEVFECFTCDLTQVFYFRSCYHLHSLNERLFCWGRPFRVTAVVGAAVRYATKGIMWFSSTYLMPIATVGCCRRAGYCLYFGSWPIV